MAHNPQAAASFAFAPRSRRITLGHMTSEVVLCERAAEALRRAEAASFVLMDEAVAAALGITPREKTPGAVVASGEAAKSRESFDGILEAFFAAGLKRADTVAVVGGGALCDVGAFAASVYMRGIGLALYPTTLLAMVDAAIGGKTAVNYGPLKNMVGTFYPAHTVAIAPEFLRTLPREELRFGLAEVIKAGMLKDAEILHTVASEGPRAVSAADEPNLAWWADIIWRAAGVKMDVVEADFTERGERAFLNLGHTFAHAVEAEAKVAAMEAGASRGAWSHGDAVALGLRSALEMGVQLGITGAAYRDEIAALLDLFAYPKSYAGFSAARLLGHMKKDKKNERDAVRFVLQKSPQQTMLVSVEHEAAERVLVSMGAAP